MTMVTKENCRFATICRHKELSEKVDCFMCCNYLYEEEKVDTKFILKEIQKMQGYEPDCSSTMTTQSDGEWIYKEDVIEIIERYLGGQA